MKNFKKLVSIAMCLVMVFVAMGSVASAQDYVTLYSESGATIQVNQWEVEAYEAVGWYKTLAEVTTTLYAPDGRTCVVYNAQVAEYVAVGWYIAPVITVYSIYGNSMVIYLSELEAYTAVGWSANLSDVKTTLYASDGRSITVFKSEVESYKNVGWYETQAEAYAANKAATSYSYSNSYSSNSKADGYYYRTPTGKRYHLDPDCGGKNSYRTTNIAGLTPCSKCAK